MAKNDTFHCSVITPERAVLETDAYADYVRANRKKPV